MHPWFWIIVFLVLLIIEFITAGLTTIWFAGGALAALVIRLVNGNIWIQLAGFLVISVVLLLVTRPWAMKHLNRNRTKTNVGSLAGSTAVVTERIDTLKGTGRVTIAGLDWAARGEAPESVFEKNEKLKVVRIEGVKAIVRRTESEKADQENA